MLGWRGRQPITETLPKVWHPRQSISEFKDICWIGGGRQTIMKLQKRCRSLASSPTFILEPKTLYKVWRPRQPATGYFVFIQR